MTADLFLAGFGQGPRALPGVLVLLLADLLITQFRDTPHHDFAAIDQVPVFVDPIADLEVGRPVLGLSDPFLAPPPSRPLFPEAHRTVCTNGTQLLSLSHLTFKLSLVSCAPLRTFTTYRRIPT